MNNKNKKRTIEIHNKVSSAFQQINVDGAYGGITPRGKININFFAERFPIPKSTLFEMTGNRIIKKINDSKDSKNGIIREYNFGVYLDLQTAKALCLLLKEQISILESSQKERSNGISSSKK